MKTNYKNQWIVVLNGRPLLSTIATTKKEAKENYILGDKRGWDYWLTVFPDTKVIKVDVEVKPV